MQAWMIKNGMDPTKPSTWTPAQKMDLLGHQTTYGALAEQRNQARDALDKLGGDIPIGGGKTVKGRWSNEQRAIIADMPDGKVAKFKLNGME